MCPNIPTTELIHIIAKICDQQCLPHHIKQEILSLSNTVLDQNYFCYQGTIYRQTEGLAMGAPTSSLFSEIYLQHLEGTQIFSILVQHQIVGYFWFVDDILIAYRQSLTNIHEVLTKFNNLTPKLNFTLEEPTAASTSWTSPSQKHLTAFLLKCTENPQPPSPSSPMIPITQSSTN
jgi:hypothetical protein